MSKRKQCNRCLFPESVCICHALTSVELPVNLHILQHPSETGHSKNSARLLPLLSNQCTLYAGESANEFDVLVKQVEACPEKFAVIYPNEDSLPLEQNLSLISLEQPRNLILLDGTWRKAFKLWQLNPWLQALQTFHFESPPASRYQIRKTRVKGGVSTLEAAAYALHQCFDCNIAPLYEVFDAMQATHHSFHPPDKNG